MTGIKICGIKYDEDIGIINELKPDYAGSYGGSDLSDHGAFL